ncbi:unnamed protein product [Ceutorhynchus assimilis]|uniref:Uncharacterized protein n=1 Tax=Ceutorhynchus assimilis TaxID=467358 RepID=A0A9N9QJZ8_9CUCU|nr:unnamed protein product [Ceutorhynchus assimilis]
MNNFNDYPEIWMYEESFSKVLMESLEVGLMICNSDLHEFTAAKLFDIMNQIIPTGFVLTTGYWPFYSTDKRQSLCICGRFSLECRHNRNGTHWIDLDPIPDDYSMLFCPGKNGPVKLTPVDIIVTPVTSPPVGFMVTLVLKFSQQESTIARKSFAKRGRPNDSKLETGITICSRYTLKCEWYSAFSNIVFQPNPYFTSFYGHHVAKLLGVREQLKQNYYFNPGTMYVMNDIMPQFTIALNRCDLPTFPSPSNLTAAKYNLAEQNRRTNRSGFELEVWQYRERVSSCRPIWNNQPNIADISFDFEKFLTEITTEVDNGAQAVALPQMDENNNIAGIEQPRPTMRRRRRYQQTFSGTTTFLENPPQVVGSIQTTQPQVDAVAVRGRRRKVQFQHVQTFGDTTTTVPRSAHQGNPFPILSRENQASTEAELFELDKKWVEEILRI